MFDTGRSMAVRSSAEVPKVPDEDPGKTLLSRAQQIAPVVMAREHLLPVPAVFHSLLPSAGLQRGWTTRVEGNRSGRALAWALLADVTRSGGWIAAVDVPGISLVAASEVGVSVERVLVVNGSSAETWASAIGALIGSVDVVLFGAPQHRVTPSVYRRIASRCRERGTVLLELGGSPQSRSGGGKQLEYDLSFEVVDVSWNGLGAGHGRLLSRELDVAVGGRRAQSRQRQGRFAVPSSDGSIRQIPRSEPPALTVVPSALSSASVRSAS